jgi:hypothetical protein
MRNAKIAFWVIIAGFIILFLGNYCRVYNLIFVSEPGCYY